MNNDKLIAAHRTTIEKRLIELGDRPKIKYDTNGVLVFDNKTFNLNLLSNVENCVHLVQRIFIETNSLKKANKLLGTDVTMKFGAYDSDMYISDIKQRLSVIEWDANKRKLNIAEAKLAELMSDGAKTESAISDIANDLGL